MNKIEVLIISNKFDFTSDYVCLELKSRNVKYLRINRDCFSDYQIIFDINNLKLLIVIDNQQYICTEMVLKAIYYRAPIYLRDIYQPGLSPEEQLYRTQWTAFIRNLAIFENILWINNPVSTFKAENKLLQLKYAEEIGFACPQTIVTNSGQIPISFEDKYVIKSLDTALLRVDGKEAFVYTNVVNGREIGESQLSLSPIIVQKYLYPKTDYRVTVIGDRIYSVKILKNGHGVPGDWRKQKLDLEFVKCVLPKDVEIKCIKIVEKLGLTFGAIDLIESNGVFYFIEVNPTGEWAWLVDAAGLEIPKGICDYIQEHI